MQLSLIALLLGLVACFLNVILEDRSVFVFEEAELIPLGATPKLLDWYRRGKMIGVDGTDIFVVEQGSRSSSSPTLLILHGRVVVIVECLSILAQYARFPDVVF
jgi:hypothetical protein